MSTLVFRFMNLQISRADLPLYTLIAAWVLSMISLPIALWTIGDAALAYGTTASVLLLATATTAIIAQAWGWRRALRAVLIVAAFGWFIEFIGSKTGFPFGSYNYTNALQPQFFGVPLIIPLAWMMMMPPAWAVAQCIVDRKSENAHPYRFVLFVVFSALAFTAWDLYLDPQMVNWGFWLWHGSPTGYFGIPIVNFVGWLLASLIMTTLVRPPTLPRRALMPLLAIYGITIFLQTVGVGVFWGMPSAAVCGFLGMSALFIPAIRNFIK